MKSFGHSIYTQKINIVEAEVGQNNLLSNIVEFNNKFKPRLKKVNIKKKYLRKYISFFGRSRIN